jgi:hypothetical protein
VFGPAPGDVVLLSDARLVGKPHLYRPAGRIALADRRQARGKAFLKAAGAAESGRAADWDGLLS